MFGLMKRAERLAYCGSCKTIGALYGQRARLLLNHDMVFLAELLTDQPEWGPAHRSFNCMAMPKEHPRALRLRCGAAVVLGAFPDRGSVGRLGAVAMEGVKAFPFRQLTGRRLAWNCGGSGISAGCNGGTAGYAGGEGGSGVVD